MHKSVHNKSSRGGLSFLFALMMGSFNCTVLFRVRVHKKMQQSIQIVASFTYIIYIGRLFKNFSFFLNFFLNFYNTKEKE